MNSLPVPVGPVTGIVLLRVVTFAISFRISLAQSDLPKMWSLVPGSLRLALANRSPTVATL